MVLRTRIGVETKKLYIKMTDLYRICQLGQKKKKDPSTKKGGVRRLSEHWRGNGVRPGGWLWAEQGCPRCRHPGLPIIPGVGDEPLATPEPTDPVTDRPLHPSLLPPRLPTQPPADL